MSFSVKKYFSFQHRAFVILVLIMTIPFLLTGYMAKNFAEAQRIEEKESKLLAFTRILDAHLGAEGFTGLLRAHTAELAPRERKIAILNSALMHITEEVSTSAPSLGVGYYSRDLEAIITYGPVALFGYTVGTSIPENHPAHEVMRSGKNAVQAGTMVRGNILNAMLPIVRGDEVIGYIWANEPITDIQAEAKAIAFNSIVIMLICAGLSVGLLVVFSRKTILDMNSIIGGLKAMPSDFSLRIPPSSGEMGEVVQAINAMATEICKVTEENRLTLSVLQIVLNNVNAAVYVCDPHTKKLVYTNEYLNKLYSHADLQHECCFETLYHRNSPCPDCPQATLLDCQARPDFEPQYRESHNAVIGCDFLIMDRLITWHDSRLLHMSVGSDLTERKARVHAESANLAQRRFLAHMSHELRTPMNGVLGMTRLAMVENPPPSQMKYLKKIQSSAALLLGIINDILDFSRIEADKLALESRVFSLYEAIDRVCELVRPVAEEKGLEFSVNIDKSVPEYASGDGLRLSQVLLNLLGNASKFTLQGGVYLQVSGLAQQLGTIRLTFSVRDTGIGISEEQQQKLFDPFSQADISTSRQFGGTGLGLAISKALVELMGGQIQVRSQEGKGSEFYFSIELLAADGLPTEAETSRAWEHARYSACHFLLVEDNDINQEIAKALLVELGASVDMAENGEEAITAFMNKDYDLILMDLRMPIMDGLEATRRIRKSGKHDALTVPIIAMTANAMEEDRTASFASGMNDHIAKPFEFHDFKSTLYRHLKAKAC